MVTTQPAKERTLTDLGCDCCGTRMVLERKGTGSFCLHCGSCGQTWSISPSGKMGCRILHKLFPAYSTLDNMPNSQVYEFLAYNLSQYVFQSSALHLVGLITDEELNNRLKDARTKTHSEIEEQRVRRVSLKTKIKRWIQQMIREA